MPDLDQIKQAEQGARDGLGVALALTPDSRFVIRGEDDGRRGTEADDRIRRRDRYADTAPIEAEDSNGAENERDPMQSDAQ